MITRNQALRATILLLSAVTFDKANAGGCKVHSTYATPRHSARPIYVRQQHLVDDESRRSTDFVTRPVQTASKVVKQESRRSTIEQPQVKKDSPAEPTHQPETRIDLPTVSYRPGDLIKINFRYAMYHFLISRK